MQNAKCGASHEVTTLIKFYPWSAWSLPACVTTQIIGILLVYVRPSVRLFLTGAGPCGSARRRLYKKRPPPGTRGQFMSRSEAARGRPRLRRSPRRGPDARPGPREKAVSTTAKATSSISMMRRRASAMAAVAALGILERRFTCCRRRMIAKGL